MAPFYTGVQLSKEYPNYTLAEFRASLGLDGGTNLWSANPSVGNPGGTAPGCFRMIFFPNAGGKNTAAYGANLIKAMQESGKYVIACISPVNNAFSSVSASVYAQWFEDYIAAGAAPDAWEIGNEPGAVAGAENTGAGQTGPYWTLAKAAADRLDLLQPTVPKLLAAPIHDQRTRFYNNAVTWGAANSAPIPTWVDGLAGHHYGGTPATVLGEANGARTQIASLAGGSWSALNMWITEFGWSVCSPDFAGTDNTSPNYSLIPGVQAPASGMRQGVPGTNADTGTVSGSPGSYTYTGVASQSGYLYGAFNALIANRVALKLRAAVWYAACDHPHIANQNGYMGLQKSDSERYLNAGGSPPEPIPPNSAGAVVPTSVPERGFRPAYFRLTSGTFDAVYDPAPPTPPLAETFTPATNITTTSATLTGRVDPQGSNTTRYFDWGTSPTLATYTRTTGVSVGGTAGWVNVSYPLTGRTGATTYYFRVVAINSTGGTTLGAIRSFTTLAPPLPPLVTTGAATNIVADAAVLNGLVDPRGANVTDYHFEYGLDPTSFLFPSSSIFPSGSLFPGAGTAYAFSTPSGTLLASGGLANVSAAIGSLLPNTKYYYRLVATNSSGTTFGSDLYFFTTPVAGGSSSTTSIRHSRKPSLAMSVEIQTADGRTYRWDQQATDMKRRAYELSFSTAAGDGFADASCVVYRPINLDYPDLQLLTKGRFIAADGSIAYEGRVVGVPRSVDDSGEVIRVQFQGLMAASGKDRPFTEVYCDRSGERWRNATLRYRLAMANETPNAVVLDADFTGEANTGSLHFKGTTQKVISVSSQGVLEWQAPSNCKAKAFQYKGTERNIAGISGTPYEQPVLYYADAGTASGTEGANMGSWDSQALTLDGTVRTATLNTARDFLGLRLRLSAAGGFTPTAAQAPHRTYSQICVYGDHGVPLQDNGQEPDGVFASDVMRDIIDRFCPLLDSSEIVQTSALIEHLVYDTPVYPFDALTFLNGFHLWLLGAYEGGKVVFRPPDLTKTDWLVRRSSEGVTLDLEGDSIDAGVANGMPVSYTDIDERQIILWPDQYPQLRDDNPDNPANKEGVTRWPFVLELSRAATKKMALRLGEVALLETNRAKQRGTINVVGGYVMDGNENPRPASEVRYGDTIAIADLPNDLPRLITATTWQEDGSLSITLEQPPSRVDAVIARLEQAVFLNA